VRASTTYKSAAAASGNASRLGKGILWNIGPFDVGSCFFFFFFLLVFAYLMVFKSVNPVPVFNAIGKTFSLDKGTLRDLGMAGLGHFKGEVPSGSFVLVGYMCSWWCPTGDASIPKLSFNLNWVVVLGVPSVSD
jgi:hypothetical protein